MRINRTVNNIRNALCKSFSERFNNFIDSKFYKLRNQVGTMIRSFHFSTRLTLLEYINVMLIFIH